MQAHLRAARSNAVSVVVVVTRGAVVIERSDAPPRALDAQAPWAVIPADVPFVLVAEEAGAARVVEIQVL